MPARIRDAISKYFFYPILYTYKNAEHRAITRSYRTKRRLQFADEEELKRIQLAKLRDLLIYAGEHSPFYRRVFRERGFIPKEFKDFRDLKKLPILTKETIQDNIEDMKVPGARGLFANSSGGSTGVVLNFYQDSKYKIHSIATTFISDELQGWYFGCRTARLWGAPSDLAQIYGLKARLKLYLRNEEWYDTFDMSPERMLNYHSRLSRFRPDVIIAYASSAFIFARFLRENQIRPNYPRRSIITSAETLFDDMRETIEEAFGVPVFNRYGSREVGNVASECSHKQGLHLHPYDHYVECLDPVTGEDVWDEPGELIITVLNNYGVPFIRYQIGDMGILTQEKCTCGRQGPLLKKVLGRTSNTITAPNGRLVHGEYFTHLFYGLDGIRKFQLIQENLTCFRVLIVPKGNFRPEVIGHLRKEIAKVVGERSAIEFELVDDIPVAASGKYLFTISKVPVNVALSAARRMG